MISTNHTIDEMLGELICLFSFIDSDKEASKDLIKPERNGPLSTFVERINYSYAIGLLNKEQKIKSKGCC